MRANGEPRTFSQTENSAWTGRGWETVVENFTGGASAYIITLRRWCQENPAPDNRSTFFSKLTYVALWPCPIFRTYDTTYTSE